MFLTIVYLESIPNSPYGKRAYTIEISYIVCYDIGSGLQWTI